METRVWSKIEMKRKEYSAGAVKLSFWFVEFRKTVELLNKGQSFSQIKSLVLNENLFAAPTTLRANQIFNTVTGRIKSLEGSFTPLFLQSDLSTQKLFALVAAMAYDTLFFDFVYEVIREKILLGICELSDSDVRIFFKDKQQQNEKVRLLNLARTLLNSNIHYFSSYISIKTDFLQTPLNFGSRPFLFLPL